MKKTICFEVTEREKAAFDYIKRVWVELNPHQLDTEDMWEIQKNKGQSGLIRLLINHEFHRVEAFCKMNPNAPKFTYNG